MSEIKSLAAPKASFDRRSVVKGAAWSVPVIAAAIAAPAASASARNASAGFDGLSGAVSFAPTDPKSKAKPGTGPTGFTITNYAGAIAGPISGTVTIQPATSGTADPGVGFLKLTGATSFTPQPLTASKVFVGTFTANGIPANDKLSFSMDPTSYYYTGGNGSPARDFSISVSFTLPDGTRPNVNLDISPVTLHIAKN
ncbi:hypothetical protein [Arthrobacter sp. LAR12-1-1.1]|uniref:hypothetical protein n=1 Tax=Arthrobacter sp. LAR12-1-1.1 TaxID=3135215 RepID=UPI003416D1AC